MRRIPYTTADSIGDDSRSWMAALEGYVRHPGPGDVNRPALVVLDLQKYFLDPAGPAFMPSSPAILANVRRLVALFHGSRLPVCFTRHQDPPGVQGQAMQTWWGRRLEPASPWAELVPDCGLEPGDKVIDKGSYSAFRDTDLRQHLLDQGVKTVVLAGIQTHLCVETTTRDAFQSGFSPLVVLDATAAPDLDLHLGSLRSMAQGFARVCPADAVETVLSAARGKLETSPSRLSVPESGEVPTGSPLDLLVVGSGPAGIAAAVQGHRMGLVTRLLERDRPGGLVNAANRVENYPGFPGGIRGIDLGARLYAHAGSAGVQWVRGDVAEIAPTDGNWTVLLADGTQLAARAVVVATGTGPRRLGIPGEDELADELVFYRIDRAMETLKGSRATVVGGGDCALDQALQLWHRGYRVSVLVRDRRPKALTLLSRHAAETGIRVDVETETRDVRRNGQEAVLSTKSPDGHGEVASDFVLVAVGRRPRLPRVKGIDTPVLIAGTDLLGRTAHPGLYLAGDCRRGWIRQTAVAAGDGVASAMDAWRYLETGKWK